jgi:hypothetical protein
LQINVRKTTFSGHTFIVCSRNQMLKVIGVAHSFYVWRTLKLYK